MLTPADASADRLTTVSHVRLASAVRVLAMDAVERAKSGHPGMPMGAADMATVLFTRFLNFDPLDPAWPDRDRFVLSAGHGSMLLYALLHLIGVPEMTVEELKRFRQWGSKTPGHPEYGHTVGVETTTGPLGQGLATAVGMALAERMMAARYGDSAVDHRTYVLASDGDLMEGISQEAIAIAGHHRLSKLIVLFDDNGISIDGPLSIADSVDQVKRFEAAGWAAVRVDGHSPEVIAAALAAAQTSDRPTLIACRTIIGYGAPTRAGLSKAHGEPLGAEEIIGARLAYEWDHHPFELPDDVVAAWKQVGVRGRQAREAWTRRVEALSLESRDAMQRDLSGALPAAFEQAVQAFKTGVLGSPTEMATRKASEAVLKAIAPVVPALVTGSADLTGSNNTKVEATPAINPDDFSGRFVHWGVREHGMAAALNGMALHGGFIPSGASFLVFTDYCRPAIRLAALMGLRVIHVMTHDSIGLGEDGPTHQPVEHLASLRAIPNLLVFRPADAIETAECWQAALEAERSPSILALSRQNLPPVRLTSVDQNLSARGAYELSPAVGNAQVSLFASGSEVSIALEAQELLKGRGIAARVVSVPCLDLFQLQDQLYRSETLGAASVNVAVEAGVRQGWDGVIGMQGIFIGMQGFGASAPYKELYEHFGITAKAAVEAVLARLQ